MPVTTMTSRAFNQDAGGAKKAAAHGPVIITERGRPAHVLLSYAEYRKLAGGGRSLLEIVTPDEEDDIEFDPPRINNIFRPVEFD